MTTPPAQLADAGYRSIIQIPVFWGDQDAFAHVNNTVPIRWFESSRIAYLEHSGMGELLEAAGLGPILASIHCNYRRQLRYPDAVWVGAKVTRLGRTSLTMAHAVWAEKEQAIAADGDSVVVIFDYQAHRPRAIPENLRATLAVFEGHSLEA